MDKFREGSNPIRMKSLTLLPLNVLNPHALITMEGILPHLPSHSRLSQWLRWMIRIDTGFAFQSINLN